MKILKWFFIVLVVLVVVGLSGIFIFVRNFDANQYKDRIIKEVSAAIDRPVAVGNIALDLNWAKGVNLELEDCIVLETSPSDVRIASVKRVHLGVDLAALITTRKLTVTLIELVEPYVRYVRYADGTTNIDSFVPTSSSSPSEGSPTKKAESANGQEIKLNDLKVSSVEIKNGRVLLETHLGEEVQALELSQIDLSIKGVAFDQDFPARLALNAFSDKQNIKVDSVIHVSPSTKRAVLSKVHSAVALNSFDGAKLLKAAPQLKGSGIEFPMSGEILVRMDQVLLSESGLESYKGEIRLSDARLKIEALDFPIENIDFLMVLASPRIDIKDIFMYVGSGEIKGLLSLDQALSTNAFEAQFNILSLELAELLAHSVGDYKLSGKLNGTINAAGEHHAANPIAKSLNGNATFDVTGGKIEGLNVLKTVLGQLSFIPNMQQKLDEKLPQKYKDKLEQKDTWIDELRMETILSGDRIIIKEAALASSGFQVESNGQIDLKQDLSLNADLFMDAELASVVLGDDPDLAFLLDSENRMHIPFKPYRGSASRLMIYPDIESLSKLAIQNKGKQELRKALFKALDLEEGAKKQEGAEDATSAEPNPQEALIESVFDAIFK